MWAGLDTAEEKLVTWKTDLWKTLKMGPREIIKEIWRMDWKVYYTLSRVSYSTKQRKKERGKIQNNKVWKISMNERTFKSKIC